MKAITLRQPWASLVAVGAKPYETRSWPAPRGLIGHRIAIHAGKALANALDAATDAEVRRRLGDRWAEHLPRGAVVCTAILAGAYQLAEVNSNGHITIASQLPGSVPASVIRPDLFGNYGAGRWAWRLAEIKRLDPPPPARGAQGFWSWA